MVWFVWVSVIKLSMLVFSTELKKNNKKKNNTERCCSYAITSNKHINEGANRIYTCRATIWTLQTVFMDFNSHFKISITIILRKNVQIGTWRNQNLWWKIHKNSLKRSNVSCTRKPKPCQIVPCAKSYNMYWNDFYFFIFFLQHRLTL